MKEMTNEEIKKGVIEGFKEAINKLIEERKLKNQDLVILKDGKIVKVNANEI